MFVVECSYARSYLDSRIFFLPAFLCSSIVIFCYSYMRRNGVWCSFFNHKKKTQIEKKFSNLKNPSNSQLPTDSCLRTDYFILFSHWKCVLKLQMTCRVSTINCLFCPILRLNRQASLSSFVENHYVYRMPYAAIKINGNKSTATC